MEDDTLDILEDNEIKPLDDDVAERRSGRKNLMMWTMVMMIYMVLLASIGYIAFWDQDFNDPKNIVGGYVEILNEEIKKGNIKEADEDRFEAFIQEVMKKNADSAGDLQELASQSFNIVLGALLAFLSASASVVFQRFGGPEKGTSK